MNLLLLVHGLPIGGTEVMVCHLARWLRRGGLRVSIGCLDELGELGRQLIAEDFAVEVYHRRPGFDGHLPLKIARTVRRLAIDVVHAHQYTPFFYGVLSKVVTRTPLVFTEHGREHPDYPRLRRRAFNACFSPLTDRVTTVSRAVRDALVRIEGFSASRIEVIYNGIDIGHAYDVAIDDADPKRVIVTLQIDPKAKIHVDSVATLESQGLTGAIYVEIEGGTATSDDTMRGSGTDPAEIEQVIEAGLENYTEHTIVDGAALRKELETIREIGYSVNSGEWRTEISGVAAAVIDADGLARAAISVAVPAHRLRESDIPALGRLVHDAVERI